MLSIKAESLKLFDSSGTLPGYFICFNTYLSNNNHFKILLSSTNPDENTHLYIHLTKCRDASYCVVAIRREGPENSASYDLEEVVSEPILLEQAGWVHTCLEFDHINSNVSIHFNGQLVEGLEWRIPQAFSPEKVVVNWMHPSNEVLAITYEPYLAGDYVSHFQMFPERFTMFNIFTRYLFLSVCFGSKTLS